MQARERYRLMELYRNETAGRVSLGVKCAAYLTALSVLALVGLETVDTGTAETTIRAVARADQPNAYDKTTVPDYRRIVSVTPASAP
jgi:hypothetical protein